MQKQWGIGGLIWFGWGIALMAITGLGQELQAQGGKVQFRTAVHDFGKIKEEEGRVTARFVFKNTGTAPVKLTSVKTSCGCTTSDWTRTEVSPGDSGTVEAIFNPDNRPGPFDKGIVVTTSGTPSSIILRIRGDVVPKPKGPDYHFPFQEGNIRFKTNHITFGSVLHDQVDSAFTILYNLSDKPIKVLPKQTQIPSYIRVVAQSRTIPPHDTLRLDFQFNPALKKDWGFFFEYFFLATDDPEKPMKRVNLSADIREHFENTPESRRTAPKLVLDKVQHDFGKISQSEEVAVDFVLKNEGMGPLMVRKVQVSCGCTVVDLEKEELAIGEQATMKVTFNPGTRTGNQQKEINLITNDPSRSVIQIKLLADVQAPKPLPDGN
jgi:hypothetical protein